MSVQLLTKSVGLCVCVCECVFSMDDGSSISSGEISDAVAGVSTDDNITVGSSLSAHSYGDRAALASQRAAVLHMGSVTLQTSSARRHAAAERSTLPITEQSRPAVTAGGAVFIRRSNQAVVTDLKARTLRSGTAVAIDDPARCLATVTSSSSSNSSSVVKQKKDSETNTDNSTLMMLAQRSRLAAEYSGSGGAAARATDRQRSLTRARLTSATDTQHTDGPRSSSLGRTQSDSRTREARELQSSRKPSVSETDDLDEMAYQYYSSSVARSRCSADDDQAAAAAAAVYHNEIAHQLSASGGQYIVSVYYCCIYLFIYLFIYLIWNSYKSTHDKTVDS